MTNHNHIKSANSIREWFRYHFIEKKLSSWPGVLILCTLGILIGYYSIEVDYRAGVGVLAIFIVFFVILLLMKNVYFGIYLILAYSALPSLLFRMFIDSPIKINFSLPTNALIIIVLIGLFGKVKPREIDGPNFWSNPMTASFVILSFYYILEALNPNMFSILGWLSYFRNFLFVFAFFYILFILLNSWKRVKEFIYFNIILFTILAAYACKQQWFGLTDFEMRWATQSPETYLLLFQGGFLRKWSTLSDPATSGVSFAAIAVLCVVLLVRVKSMQTKILLGIALIFNLLGYTYSGTRTATLMLIAGLAFYSIATIFEKRTLVFVVVATGLFGVLMTSPYSPPSIERIKSTFQGNKDLSALVREYHRHTVQPYLYAHPMGGGIFTTGFEGPTYNPGHYLTDFQPDSGYMRVFAEQGWIGLAIMLITYSIILIAGLRRFYKISNPEFQDYSIALISMIFSIMVSQYSQFVADSYPLKLFFLGALVFFVKMPYFEKQITNSQTPIT